MSVNLKTLHLASPKHKHKFESTSIDGTVIPERSPDRIATSPILATQQYHHKSLSESSMIEENGEKFYSPINKNSDNASNHSDLDAVRQILQSPELIATSPKKQIQANLNIKVEKIEKSKSNSGIAQQKYTPMIRDRTAKPTTSVTTSTTSASTTAAATSASGLQSRAMITRNPNTDVVLSDKDQIPIENAEGSGLNDTANDNSKESSDVDTIRSSTSNISNKTEKALKYEELKISQLKTMAKQLYDHTYSEAPVEEYLMVLCDPSNPEAKKLRLFYLKQFDWNNSLLESLRTLCKKLYFRGESQYISRIIESFSVVWTQRFPKNIFGNQYAVYLIAYSLILLNSDLHSAELSKHISKETFVKNTLNALKIENLYPKDSMSALNWLKTFYDSIELNELRLLGQPSSSTKDHSSGSNGHGNGFSSYTHSNGSFVKRPSVSLSRSTNNGNSKMVTGKLHSSKTNENNGTLSNSNSLMLKPVSDSYALKSSISSSSGNNSLALQQPIGFMGALQRGTSQMSSRLDKTSNLSSTTNLKKHRSSASITSAMSSHTVKSVETSNTTNTYSSHTNKQNGSGHVGNSVRNSTDTDDNMIMEEEEEEEEDNEEEEMELELTGPPWVKEGLLKIKKFERTKNFFGMNSGKSNSSNGLSNSASGHFGKNFFNNAGSSYNNGLSRTSTNTSSVGRNHKSYNNSNNALKWKLNFTVVTRGEVKLFSFNSKNPQPTSMQTLPPPHSSLGDSPSKLRKKFSKLKLGSNTEPIVVGAGNSIETGIGDGNWMRNAQSSGTFSLVSTYSKIIPDDSIQNKSLKSKELETFWALKLPSNYDFESDNSDLPSKIKKEVFHYINSEDNILIFSAGTREVAEEYVFTCNYWAARLTAIPTQTESISNKEFGWGPLLYKKRYSDIINCKIHKWEPLVPSVVSSNLSVKKQLIELFKYVQTLENLISEHLKLKDSIDEFVHSVASENQKHLLPLNKVFNAVMANWNNKYSYLVNEHNQFKDYVLTLKEAIDLKQKRNIE